MNVQQFVKNVVKKIDVVYFPTNGDFLLVKLFGNTKYSFISAYEDNLVKRCAAIYKLT